MLGAAGTLALAGVAWTVVPNDSDTTRAQNRRVELTTVPRQGAAARTAQQQAQGTDSNG